MLGEWQKPFVAKLKAEGASHDIAMAAAGLTAEECQKAYMQGYDKGYKDRGSEAIADALGASRTAHVGDHAE